MKLPLRDPISAITHLAAAAAALVGLLFLLRVRGQAELAAASGMAVQPHTSAALLVYGVSLFVLFLSSGVYHSVQAGPRAVQALRKLDHSAIYLLIAGTYTPFCVLAFRGFWQWGFLAIIWGLAVIGIVSKLFLINAPRWFAAGVYVIMGWLSVFAVREMLAVLPPETIRWLVAGGVIYTLGAGVYITKKFNFLPGVFGFHEVWHIFVMLAAGAHFLAVWSLVASRV